MSILDLLYREYCRARLAEMRKQLLVITVSDNGLDIDWDATNSAKPGHRGNDLDDTATSDASSIR